MGRRCLRSFLSPLLALVQVIYGCAGVQLKDVVVKPAAEYNNFQAHSGVNVAVDLFLQDERVIEAFGDNLVSRGYLPVLFVFENRSVDRAFLVAKGELRLLLDSQPSGDDAPFPEGPGRRKGAAQEVTREASGQTGALGAVAMGSVLLTPVVVFAPVLFLAAPVHSKIEKDAFKITRNLEKRELVDRTIYPGESCNGFVYFPWKRGSARADVRAVQIRLKDVKTLETVTVSIAVRE